MRRISALPVLFSGLLLLVAMASAAAPAQASFRDKFFTLLKTVSPGDADRIELARYYIDQPERANRIYAKATGDRIYDGLLIGAKVARDKPIPGTSLTFNSGVCTAPVHMFDAVFAKSDAFIQQYGQQSDVKAYFQAKNESGKQQALAQVAAVVPYFADIEDICDFTFSTHFNAEDTLQTLGGASWHYFKDAYNDFSNGNITNGVGDLLGASIAPSTACSVADQLLTGGVIEKTPVLGSVASSACAGFAGAVIKGAKAVGHGAVTAISDLGDVLSGQSDHMPPEQYYAQYFFPHLLEAVADERNGTLEPLLDSLWHPCVAYFDGHKMSTDSAQETCDILKDHQFRSDVQARFNAQDANMKAIDQGIIAWKAAFAKTWTGECPDPDCETQIYNLAGAGMKTATALKPAHFDDGWAPIKNVLDNTYTPQAQALVAHAKQAFAATNKTISDKAAPAWAQIAIGVWTPQCLDALCVQDVKDLSVLMIGAIRLIQMALPNESSLHIQGIINTEYAAKFQKLIDASKARKIIADPNAPPSQKLPAMGCGNFLGRANEYWCHDAASFAACVGDVKNGTANYCMSSVNNGARIYAPMARMRADLKYAGCVSGTTLATSLTFRCDTTDAVAVCTGYASGGAQISCVSARKAGP